jgi:hypothetical protein
MQIGVMESESPEPEVHINLLGKQTNQLDEIEVGSGVRIVIEGKVSSYGEEQYGGNLSGHVCVKSYRIRVIPTDNQFEELVEE